MLFSNPLLLFGLAAAAIPLAVHFFGRQRYDEVEWGAMRFLRLTPRARRKLYLEQWLLMALRTAVLGLLAIALAGPSIRTSWFTGAESRLPRSTVVLIDRSASMEVGTAAAASKEWVVGLLDQARSGDRIAVFAVTGAVAPIAPVLTSDLAQVRGALELLPAPRGTANWPAAVGAAARLLAQATEPRDIVIVADGQKFSWSDGETLAGWELLTRSLAAEGTTLPRTWVVDVAAGRPRVSPSVILQPIQANRSIATSAAAVAFESSVSQSTPGEELRVRLEIDGRPAGSLPVPRAAEGKPETVVSFSRRFPPGSHLVTLRTPTDRQDFALDVVPVIPVLIVDGELRPDARSLGSDFLRDALAPLKDPSPSFAVRTVSASQFAAGMLKQDVKGPGSAPRVLVLVNVAQLTTDQSAAVEVFLVSGGGVLVAPGDRADAAAWERFAYRNGGGWLPARLVETVATDPDSGTVAKPRTSSFERPPVQVFRDDLPGGLQTAYFPRYWRLAPPPIGANSLVLGSLTNGDPFMVEKSVGPGSVIETAVPLDNSWRTNLTVLPDFVRLAHELVYHLASTSGAANLRSGDRLVFRPRDGEPPGPVTVTLPDGTSTVVAVREWPMVFDATHEPGAYRLSTAGGRVRYYAVRPDPREADLTRAEDSDRDKVAQVLGGVEYVSAPNEFKTRRGRGPTTHEFGGLILFAVLVLLAAELWYARKLEQRQ